MHQLIPIIDGVYKVVIIFFNCLASWHYLTHINKFKNILTQLLIIVTLVCLFLNSALFFNFNDVGKLSYAMVFSCDLLLFVLLFIWLKDKYYKSLSFNNAQYIIVIILIYSIIKLFFIINYIPRWDGYVYYHGLLNGVKNYDFSLKSYLMGFRYSLYSCYAYYSFLSIGQFIDFGNVYLLNIQHHILSLVTIFCFYKIFIKLFPNISLFELSIITLIFSLSPILFSVSFIASTDTAIVTFYLIFLYCYFYRKSLLLIFSGVVLCTSKEPGIILYLFSVLGILFYIVSKDLKDKKSIYQAFKENINLAYFIIPIIIFAILKIASGLIYPTVSFGTFWDSKGFNCFGINLDIIKDRFFQMFLVNFQWIFLLTIILFVLKKLYDHVFLGGSIFINFTKYSIFIFSFLAYLLFNFIFITWAHPRYISALIFFEILFFYLAIYKIVKQFRFRIIILSSVLLLNFISVFRTFDPITLAIFRDRQFLFGNHKIVTMGKYHDDSMLYNGQFVFIDLLFNIFNKEFNISKNDTILFSNQQWEMGYDMLCIDNLCKKRTFKTEGSFVPVAYYDIANNSIKSEPLPSKGYYLSFNWSKTDSDNLTKVKTIYDVSNCKTIKSDGYSLDVYELKKIRPLTKGKPMME